MRNGAKHVRPAALALPAAARRLDLVPEVARLHDADELHRFVGFADELAAAVTPHFDCRGVS
jgi:hypothetical protein